MWNMSCVFVSTVAEFAFLLGLAMFFVSLAMLACSILFFGYLTSWPLLPWSPHPQAVCSPHPSWEPVRFDPQEPKT